MNDEKTIDELLASTSDHDREVGKVLAESRAMGFAGGIPLIPGVTLRKPIAGPGKGQLTAQIDARLEDLGLEGEALDMFAYAFVGWALTCIVWQDDGYPDEPDKPWLERLGATPLGWRFDAACRHGWQILGWDAEVSAWARQHLLPMANDFIRGCLLGETMSKGT